MGKHRTDKEWLELIQECRSSGYNDFEWCKLNGIPTSTFYTNLKKFRQKAMIDEQPSRPIINDQQEVVQVNLGQGPTEHNPNNATDVALHLNIRGISIDVLNGANRSTIENTLSALRSLC